MSLFEFEILAELGKGAYGSVYKVRRIIDNEIYALKKVPMSKLNGKEKENSLNEIRILASVNHQNVVSYIDAFYDEDSSALCIVMEFLDDGDLESKINKHIKSKKKFQEFEIWHIFKNIVAGLKALHDKKILHRDLKSANIFMSKKGQVKIGDMNVSKIIKSGVLYTQTGTPYYASPEVWKDSPYDYKSDIWSLGCLLYEMTTLKPPFRGNSMEEVYSKVIKGVYEHISPLYSRDLSFMISNLLVVNPQCRPSCDLIIAKIGSKHAGEVYQDDYYNKSHANILLQTLKMPKNMKEINKMVPKSNYKMRILSAQSNRLNMSLEKEKTDDSGLNNSLVKNNQQVFANRPVSPIYGRRSRPKNNNHSNEKHSYILDRSINNHSRSEQETPKMKPKSPIKKSPHRQPKNIDYLSLVTEESNPPIPNKKRSSNNNSHILEVNIPPLSTEVDRDYRIDKNLPEINMRSKKKIDLVSNDSRNVLNIPIPPAPSQAQPTKKLILDVKDKSKEVSLHDLYNKEIEVYNRLKEREKLRPSSSVEKINQVVNHVNYSHINQCDNSNLKQNNSREVSPKNINGYYYLNSIKNKKYMPDYLKSLKYDEYKSPDLSIAKSKYDPKHINSIKYGSEVRSRKQNPTRNILTNKERKENVKEREKELIASKNKILERLQSGKPTVTKVIQTNNSKPSNNIIQVTPNDPSKERDLVKMQKRLFIENYLSNGNEQKLKNIPSINITKDGILIANKSRVVSAKPLNYESYLG